MTPNNGIIGREYEQKILANICEEQEARLIAIYGRRRVGKTYLVKRFFNEKFDFFFTGSYQTLMKDQLVLFQRAMKEYTGKECPLPKNWFDAFSLLWDYLKGLRKKRLVVFLDELPWMDTPKSNFHSAFSYFWNTWASTRNGMKLIVCGSATTWMLDKIIGDKGGLYGRTNRSIYLAPFNLGEVELFLQRHKGINWNRRQIAEAYMIFGGIPYYLDMLERDLPLSRNVDNLFFREKAALREEYDFLFQSLFKNAVTYRKVIELLSSKRKGMTMQEILDTLNAKKGGSLSDVLKNLCRCDFVRKYSAYGKKERGVIYQLTDLFSLYYLTFIGNRTGQDEHFWTNVKESTKNTWAGYAFEQLCLHHVRQIRSKLSIGGVLTNVCSWSCPPMTDADGTDWNGAQIDLLLCRGDETIHLCEMKYSSKEFAIDGSYEETLRTRLETFAHHTKTNNSLRTTMITTYGVKPNKYSGIMDDQVRLDDLFVRMDE